MSAKAEGMPPKARKYVLGALIALLILIPLWTLFVMVVIQPDSLMTEEQTMGNRLLWWAAMPMVVVAMVVGGRWLTAAQQTQAQGRAGQAPMQQAAASDQARREYVLEVIGLGVTLDKYRQGALWAALQKGSPHGTIREQDPKKYDWSSMDKDGTEGGRQGSTLENGAQYTPMYWGVPVFNAVAPIHNDRMRDEPNDPRMGLAGSAEVSGMAWHLFVTGPRRFEERPDRILEDVFAFFDAHPDIPYIVLNSHDGMGTRDENLPDGAPAVLKDGYYIPEMPDSSALFVLARRERVDPLRPFVWDDPDNDFVQENLRHFYYDLQRLVPVPESRKNRGRQPRVDEWLPAAAKYAQHPDLGGGNIVSALGNLNPFAHHPPRNWKPTPWFPIPWNRDQLDTFDRLPTLGYLHRPTFVKFTDEQGKPITRRDEREKVLQAGWEQALQSLPEAERAKSPARVIVATGGNTDQLVMLHGVLNHKASRGGPEIDSGKSSQFIDTDKRLGNTGATTLFMQMAIGVMGSYRDGGVSAAVNLRDAGEASIVLITPPSEEKRKNQHHPAGGDVFRHKVTPAIDPADYAHQ